MALITNQLRFILLIVVVTLCNTGCNNKQGSKSTTTEPPKSENEFVYQFEHNHYTELGIACKDGDIEKVTKLIQGGAHKDPCMSDDVFEYPAIYVAIVNGKTNIMEYLIDQGDDINRPLGENGNTPIQLALISDNIEAAKLLLHKGADIYTTNYDGRSVPDMVGLDIITPFIDQFLEMEGVICTETSPEDMMVVKECTYKNKTLKQVHEYLYQTKHHLKSELPSHDAEYNYNEFINVNYQYINKKHLLITLEYSGGVTTIDLKEDSVETVSTITYSFD